jgi:hypothetical protein
MKVLARIVVLALAMALPGALAAAPAGATHSRGKCRASGKTIAKNDSGRVYETETADGASVLWGCLWSRNSPVEMEVAAGDDFTTFESYGGVILRGRHVAWVFTSEDISCKADCPPGYDATTEYVNVFDLKRRAGETTRSDPAFDSLRLNSGGATAWLTLEGSNNYGVNAWDRKGHLVLDQGPIRRFRLRGPTLSWINGDVPHSATLR